MGLGFVFTARDMASRKFDRITTKFNRLDTTTEIGAARMTANLNKAKMAFAGFAVAGLALAGTFAVAGKAGEFQQEIARVGAVSRATAAELKLLDESATAAGLATQFSPKEAAQGLGVLATQGFNAAEATKALVPALDLAAGGSIGVAEASKAMSSALKVFGLDVNGAALAADKMLRITNVTALQASDLALALGTVGRGASATKQSLDEMLPAMGLVKNTGVDASVAASSVSSALLAMAKNADKFTKLGVSVTDTQGRFRPFMDIVIDSEKALSQYSNAAVRTKKATELFGRFGLTAFAAISAQTTKGIKGANGEILKGAEAVDFLRHTMKTAGGASKEFRDRLLANFAGQKQLLSGIAETLLIEIGKPFAAVLSPVVKGIAFIMKGMISLFQALPGPMKKAAAGIMVIGLLTGLLVGGTMLLSAAYGLLAPAAATAWAAVAPFLPIIIGIGIAVGVVTGLMSLFGVTFEDVGKQISAFFEGLKSGFNKVIKPFTDALSKAFAELKKAWAELSEAFSGGSKKTGKGMKLTAKEVKSAGEIIGGVLSAIVGFFTLIVTGVVWMVTALVKAFTWLKEAWDSDVERLRAGARKLSQEWEKIERDATRAFQGIKDAANSVIDPIVDTFRRMATAIREAFEGIQDSIIRTLRDIPDWALPDQMVTMKQIALTSDERRAVGDRSTFTAQPAVAQARQSARTNEARGFEEIAAALRENAKELAEFRKSRPMTITLDGRKVGEAVEGARRNEVSRTFVSVAR